LRARTRHAGSGGDSVADSRTRRARGAREQRDAAPAVGAGARLQCRKVRAIADKRARVLRELLLSHAEPR
jgi:hypothetical protein